MPDSITKPPMKNLLIMAAQGIALNLIGLPAHPKTTCLHGAGPELFFPFPYLEVFILNVLGQGWATYEIHKDFEK